jgi:thiol:disulfide interchange protein DsbD
MKIQLSTLFLILISHLNFGQSNVQWDNKFNAATGSIEFKATIAEGWHLYSQFISDEIGPVPTTFVFEPNSKLKLIGKVVEPTPIQKYDENFEGMLDFFEGEVVFSQKVALKKSTVLKGTITYMVCNNTMCLPPIDKPITIELKK